MHLPASKKWLLWGALLSVSFAITVCFVSLYLHPRFLHADASVLHQKVILQAGAFSYEGFGESYFPQWYNRIMFPVALDQLTRMHPGMDRHLFLALRLVSAWGMFFAFFVLVSKETRDKVPVAVAGMSVLALGLVSTFNTGWENPTDFLEAFFIISFVWLALRRSWLILAAMAFLAAANKETAVFAGVIWFFLYGFSRKKGLCLKEAGYSIVLMATTYAFVLALRHLVGGESFYRDPNALPQLAQQYLLVTNFKDMLREGLFVLLRPFSWLMLLVVMFLPALLWIGKNSRTIDSTGKRLLAAAGALFGFSVCWGVVSEPRIYIPVLVIMVYVAVRSECGVLDRGIL